MMKAIYVYLAIVFGGALIGIIYFRYMDRGIPGILGLIGLVTICFASAKRAEKKKNKEFAAESPRSNPDS